MADGAPVDVLDAAALTRLAKLRELAGRDVLGELVALFACDVPPQIAACRGALDRADQEALRRAAHAVKGSAGALGATELAALCARIESAAASGGLGEASELIGGVEPAFDRALGALRRLTVEEAA